MKALALIVSAATAAAPQERRLRRLQSSSSERARKAILCSTTAKASKPTKTKHKKACDPNKAPRPPEFQTHTVRTRSIQSHFVLWHVTTRLSLSDHVVPCAHVFSRCCCVVVIFVVWGFEWLARGCMTSAARLLPLLPTAAAWLCW